MTLNEFREELAAQFSLNNVSGTEKTLMTRWVNRAVEQFLLDTHCHVVAGTISLVANQGEYSMPTNALKILEVWATGYDALEKVDPETIISLRRSAGSGLLRYYSVEGDLLNIYPTPTANGTLNTRYVPKPTALSADGDDPSSASLGGIPTTYHPVVLIYAKYWAGQQQNDAPSRNGLDYLALYETEMKKARRDIQQAGGRRMSPAKTGYPGWRRVPFDNSQDIVHG